MATTVGTILVNVIGNASGLKTTLDGAASTVTKFGAGVSRMGSRWAAGVSLPIAGLLVGIGKVGVKFDDEMSKSIAIMDDVDATMRRKMEDSALRLSEKLRFSSSEIAAGYYDLASAGFDATGALENIGTVTTFAQAGLMKMDVAGEHLAGSVKALGTELIGARDEAGAMARVADVLTAANNSALGTVEDFSQALTTRFASGMKAFNISLEEGVAFLMAFAQQNIKGREASQQAWMALRDVQSATIRAGAQWDRYGVSVYDASQQLRPMADILDQINMRMKGFSKSQIKDWLETGVMPEVPEGPAMPDKLRRKMLMDLKLPDRSVTALQKVLGESGTIRGFLDGLNNSFGEAEKVAAKQMQSIAAKGEAAFHRLQNAGIRLFRDLIPVITEFLGMASGALDKLDAWVVKFNALDDSTKKWVLQLSAVAVITGPLLMLLGNIIQLGGFAITGLQGMATALQSVASAMLKVVMAGVPLRRNALGQLVSHFSAAAKAGLVDWAAFTSALGKFWLSAKNVLSLVTTLGTRLLAIVGIVKLALIPMWDSLTDGTTNWWNVLKGLIPPLVLLEALWKKFGSGVTVSLGSWEQWVKTGKNVIEVVEDIVAIIQHGWSLIPKFFEMLGGIFTDLTDGAMNFVSDAIGAIVKGFKDMGVEFQAELEKIPVIGPVFQAAFAIAGDALDMFWDKAKEVFGWILDQAVNAAEASANIASFGLYGWAKDFLKGTGDAHGAVVRLRDSVHSLGLATGAIKPIDARSLIPFWEWEQYSRAPAAAPMGKPSLFIPGAADTDIPPALETKNIDRVREAYEQLMGDGGRAWRDVAKAVELHKKEIFGNADAMDRLWEIYKGVRDTIGPSGLKKELDGLFANQIGLEDMERFQTTFDDLFSDMFNNGEVQTELEKHLILIQNFVNSRRSLLEEANHVMEGPALASGIFSPDFFKKYGSQIEQLNKSYSAQSDEIKLLIDEYYKWANAQEAVTRNGENLTRSSEEFAKTVTAHADMVAMMADKSKELADLQLNEGNRMIRGLSRNTEKQKVEFNRTTAAMMNSWKFMTDTQLADSVKMFLEVQKLQEQYLDTVEAIDMERVASAIGVDDMVIRSFKHMDVEVRRALLRMKVAANETARTWSELATVFTTVAAFNDPEGNKWITWLGKISSLMVQATTVGNNFRNSIAGIGASFTKGDWKGVASNIIGMAQAIASAWAIMASATEGTNQMKATLGGAAAGAQIGGSTGSGWGAAIGAIVGAAIGFFRTAGKAADEAQRKVRALRNEYFDMLTSWMQSKPEITEWARIWHAFGVELKFVQTEADVAFNTEQLAEFDRKLEGIRGRFSDLIGQAEELGIGLPQDIRNAIDEMINLGIITGETAEAFRRLAGAGEVDFRKMKEAADRIGLAEDKLGKKYNQSRMNAIAKQLINDFDILNRGGANASDILDAMADEINALVNDSIKFGTTIPENMRPWIQKLIESGRLVDANGVKIDSLDGIQFGPSITTQFEEITAALLLLIDELKKLPGLFAAIGGTVPRPDIPDIDVPGDPADGNPADPGPAVASIKSAAAIRDAYDAAVALTRRGSVAGISTSSVNRGRSVVRDILVYPVAVGDATNIDDLADHVVARLPEDISDNRSKIKYAIITAARATNVPRRTRR